MEHLPALPGLFLIALLAATVLPAQSEFALAGLHLAGAHDKHVLVAVATAGNVLGSTVNWVLGRYLVHFQNRRWFPIKGRAGEGHALLPALGRLDAAPGLGPDHRRPAHARGRDLPDQPVGVRALVTIGKAARYLGVVAAV